jgi:hypothetical protein
MKNSLIKATLLLVLLLGVITPVAMGQRHGRNDRRCRMEYNRAVREANRTHGPGRRARLAQARREYNDCTRRR